MVSSAKANAVEPFAWLRACYSQLPYHRDGKAFAQCEAEEPVTSDELDALLPDKWLESNPESRWEMGEQRRHEREAADSRKRYRRLNRKRK